MMYKCQFIKCYPCDWFCGPGSHLELQRQIWILMIINSTYFKKNINSKTEFWLKIQVFKTVHTLGSVTTEDINIVKYSKWSNGLVWVGGSVSAGGGGGLLWMGVMQVCVCSAVGGGGGDLFKRNSKKWLQHYLNEVQHAGKRLSFLVISWGGGLFSCKCGRARGRYQARIRANYRDLL